MINIHITEYNIRDMKNKLADIEWITKFESTFIIDKVIKQQQDMYLINLRISEAIRMLKSSTISLTDIALDTGFYSSQHFSTTFKKLTGYTPGHFRKPPNP